ncbi:MAG TPA: hypothetical protein VMV18_09305, partial [bacterium]|nr:hypothetical protein [bacterium]
QHALDMFVPGRAPGPHLPLRTVSYIFDREVLGKGAPERVPPGVKPDQIWTLPNYHHVTNIFLYAVDGLLLLWLLSRVLNPWAATISALIWVAHPVHAEGVCWVSGRKEMLAAGFVFGALLSYIYGTERLGPKATDRKPVLAMAVLFAVGSLVGWLGMYHPVVHVAFVHGLTSLALLLGGCVAYGVFSGGERGLSAGVLLGVSVFCALCGALSKPVAICIAPILVAWEIGYRPRLAAQAAAERVFPGLAAALEKWAASSGGIAAASAWIRKRLFSYDEFWGLFSRQLPQAAIARWGAYVTLGLAESTQVLKSETWNAAPKSQGNAALGALWLDIYHLVAPLDLSALYDVKSDQWYWTTYAGLGIAFLIPVVAAWLLWKNPKSLLWLAFWLVPLIPVSGIVRLASIHADRYLFIPAVALAVGLGVLLATAAFGSDEETGLWERWMAVVLTVAIVGGFGVLSLKRTWVWEKDEFLWGDAVAKNPDLPSARNNYGAALMNAGKVQEALDQYYAAYKLLPTLDVAQFNIAATEMRLGHPDVARRYAEEFNAQHKEMPTGWILLAQVYQQNAHVAEQQGNKDGAQQFLDKADEAFLHGCDTPVDKDSILQLADRITACNQLASLRTSRGQDEKALAAFDMGFKYAQPNTTPWKALVVGRTRYWAAKGDLGKADTELQRLPEGDPDRLRGESQIEYQRGNKQKALDLLEELLKGGRGTQRDLQIYQNLQQQMQQNAAPSLQAPDPGKNFIPGLNHAPGL